MKEELLAELKEEYKRMKGLDENRRIAMLVYNHLLEIGDDTNKIYTFEGATTKTSYNPHFVDVNDPDAATVLYWDIESPYMIGIPVEIYKGFEKNNKIVYGNHNAVVNSFFKEAIKSNQEEAVKKVLKKYKKK